jgi:hypothetical protein
MTKKKVAAKRSKTNRRAPKFTLDQLAMPGALGRVLEDIHSATAVVEMASKELGHIVDRKTEDARRAIAIATRVLQTAASEISSVRSTLIVTIEERR